MDRDAQIKDEIRQLKKRNNELYFVVRLSKEIDRRIEILQEECSHKDNRGRYCGNCGKVLYPQDED